MLVKSPVNVISVCPQDRWDVVVFVVVRENLQPSLTSAAHYHCE